MQLWYYDLSFQRQLQLDFWHNDPGISNQTNDVFEPLPYQSWSQLWFFKVGGGLFSLVLQAVANIAIFEPVSNCRSYRSRFHIWYCELDQPRHRFYRPCQSPPYQHINLSCNLSAGYISSPRPPQSSSWHFLAPQDTRGCWDTAVRRGASVGYALGWSSANQHSYTSPLPLRSANHGWDAPAIHWWL